MKQNIAFVWILVILAVVGGCVADPVKPQEQDDSAELRSLLQTAKEHEDKGNLIEADKYYKKALSLSPENQEAIDGCEQMKEKLRKWANKYYWEGISLYNKRKDKSALCKFRTALKFQPNHAGSLKMIKEIDSVPDPRIKCIEHIIKPKESLSIIAGFYYNDIHKYRIIAKYNRISDVTRVKIGQKIKIPETNDVTIEKLKEIQTARNKLPEPPQPPLETIISGNQGIELFDKKQYNEAIIFFEKVIDTNKNDSIAIKYLAKSHFQLAMILFEQKDYLKAKKEFEASLQYNPHNPNRSKCQKHIKECKEAYDATAVKDIAESHFQSGSVLFKKKSYLKAKKEFEASLQYNPNCSKCRKYITECKQAYMETHYKNGSAHFEQEQLENAIKEWNLVYAIDPNYKKVAKNINKAKNMEILRKKIEAQNAE